MAKKRRKHKRKAKQNRWKSEPLRQSILYLLNNNHITPMERDFLTRCYGDERISDYDQYKIKKIQARLKAKALQSVRG